MGIFTWKCLQWRRNGHDERGSYFPVCIQSTNIHRAYNLQKGSSMLMLDKIIEFDKHWTAIVISRGNIFMLKSLTLLRLQCWCQTTEAIWKPPDANGSEVMSRVLANTLKLMTCVADHIVEKANQVNIVQLLEVIGREPYLTTLMTQRFVCKILKRAVLF
jgi:hypothetical protein